MKGRQPRPSGRGRGHRRARVQVRLRRVREAVGGGQRHAEDGPRQTKEREIGFKDVRSGPTIEYRVTMVVSGLTLDFVE